MIVTGVMAMAAITTKGAEIHAETHIEAITTVGIPTEKIEAAVIHVEEIGATIKAYDHKFLAISQGTGAVIDQCLVSLYW